MGEIYDNGTATGMLADLIEGWAPIAIGTITPNTYLHSKFDYTYQYMQV